MTDSDSIGGERPSLWIVRVGRMERWRRLVVRIVGTRIGSMPAALFLLDV